MTDSPEPVRLWPPSPYQLADDSRCPACFEVASQSVCPHCGLRLDDPRTARVVELGGQILALEVIRQSTMDSIRLTQWEAAAAMAPPARQTVAAAAEVVTPEERVVTLEPLAEAPVIEAARGADADAAPATAIEVLLRESEIASVPFDVPTSAPGSDAPAAPPLVPFRVPTSGPGSDAPGAPPLVPQVAASVPRTPRRHLSVPVLLLMVGVTLVGIAAVFFLVFAWFVWGITVRALIIGGVTLAAVVGASLLRRRGLTATAEGIAVLGIILLALDAWAVRANDFFGTGDSDPALYAGVSALVIGVACRVWARFAKLRGPDVTAAVALPAGLGLVIGGALALPPVEAAVAGLLGAAAGGLLHTLPAPWSSARSGRDAVPERLVLAIIGVVALTAAAVVAAFMTFDVPVLVWSSVLVPVLGTAHALLLRPRAGEEPLPVARGLAGLASAVAVATVAIAGWQLSFRLYDLVYAEFIAPVLAVATALAVDLIRARRGGLTAGYITGWVIAALSVTAVLVSSCSQALFSTLSSWTIWQTDAFTPPPPFLPAPYLPIATAVAIGFLLLLAPSLSRPRLRELRIVIAAVLLLAAGAQTGVPVLLVSLTVALTAAAVAFARSRQRVGWVIVAILGAATAYAGGLATPWLWLIGVAVAIALPIAWGFVVRPGEDGEVALALAPIAVAVLSAFIAPGALAAATGLAGEDWQITVGLLQWIALAALLVAVAVPLERRSGVAVAFAAYVLIAVALLWTAAGYSFLVDGSAAPDAFRGAIGDPALAVVRGVALLGALTAVALARTRLRGASVYAAAALVAPSLAYAIHETLGILGVRNIEAVPLIPIAGAVAIAGLGAWAELVREVTPELRMTRLAADLGVAGTVLVVVWPIGEAHVWQVWFLLALGFAALAATDGWAAPATTPEGDAFATRAVGVPLAAAPRRLLMWPAVTALILGWWSLLESASARPITDVEVQSVPAGLVLIGFAALLVWLRRRVEATIALAAGLALALWPSAIAGWGGDELRGTIVAITAALVCVALSLRPLRGIRPPAIAGALVALAAVGLVTVERALSGSASGPAWLLLLVGTAYVSAAGMAGARPLPPACRVYALIVPPLAVALSAVATLPSTDDGTVVAAAVAVLALLHVGAAALDRLPLSSATRWTAFAGAVTTAGGAIVWGGASEVELVALPVAGMLLVGAVAAVLRLRREGRAWPGLEAIAWVASLVIATLPSIIAPAEPVRVWTVIGATLVAAAGITLSRMPDEWGVRVPSALVLALAAVGMGARSLAEPLLASAEPAAITAAAGAIAVAVLLVATTPSERPTWPPTLIAALAAALLVFIVVDRSDGELASSAVVALLGGVVGVTGAVGLGVRRWRGIAAVLTISGLVVAVSACAVRFTAIIGQQGLEPDFWLLAGGGITVGIVLMALRAVPAGGMGRAGGAVLGAAALLYAWAEFLALQTQYGLGGAEGVEEVRTVLTMSVLTLAGLAGALWRARLQWTLLIAAGIGAAVFALVATVGFGVRPVELVTVPPAIGGLLYGARRLVREPSTRSWPALGPWLVLLTVPSLVYDVGEFDLWRVVALGVVAIGLVVAGAVLKLQAPLVLGSMVVLAHGIAQLWPWITAGYDVVPWWLWLGIGGALLIFLAANYERRVRQLKAGFVAVTSLR